MLTLEALGISEQDSEQDIAQKAGSALDELRSLFRYLELPPCHVTLLLSRLVDTACPRGVVAPLMAWLWPLLHDEARNAPREHPAWRWLSMNSFAVCALQGLEPLMAAECLKNATDLPAAPARGSGLGKRAESVVTRGGSKKPRSK